MSPRRGPGSAPGSDTGHGPITWIGPFPGECSCGKVGLVKPTPTLARRFWEAIEPIHAVVYFAAEPADAARRAGLRGFWMGYFAGRVAPMGPVPPASVAAIAYGFAPAMVARAIPDAWRFADPAAVLDARITGAAD